MSISGTTVVMEASARLLAGPSLNGEESHFSSAILVGEARLHQKRDIELGEMCDCKGTATISAQEGSGLFSLATKSWGFASVEAEAVTDGNPSLSIGRPKATATVTAESSVIKDGCTDCVNADAYVYAKAEFYHELSADLYAFADMDHPSWQILAEAAILDNASEIIADPDVIWSAETFGTFVGEAFIGPAGTTDAAAVLTGFATTVTGTAFLFYPNGLLQLTGIPLRMQQLLPSYMCDGEIIKRILQAIGDDLERETYARDGFPS